MERQQMSKKTPAKKEIRQKKTPSKQFHRIFKDRYGYLDFKALAAFISFWVLIIIWIADQFFGKELNELMVEVFAFLVFSLLGLKTLPFKKQGMLTEHEQQQSNGE